MKYHGAGLACRGLKSGPTIVEVLNFIERGGWIPETADLDSEAIGMHGLIMRDSSDKKGRWYRMGQFHVRFGKSNKKEYDRRDGSH